MSVQAIVWVLEEAPGVRPHLVSTLIGLANHADRNGRGSFPFQSTLAEYTRKSARQVRKDLGELLDSGLIREGDQRLVAHLPADRRPCVYDLAVERTRGHDRNHSSGRRGRTTGTTVPVGAGGTTVPAGTTVPVATGTTGSPRPELQGHHDRNCGSYITVLEPTTKPTTSLTRGREDAAHQRTHPPAAPPPPPAGDGLTEIPDDFRATDAMRRWAHRDGYAPTVDLDYETAQFISYWRSEGRRKKSWPDAWMKWIRDAHTRAGRTHRTLPSPRPSTTDQRVAAGLALAAEMRELDLLEQNGTEQ